MIIRVKFLFHSYSCESRVEPTSEIFLDLFIYRNDICNFSIEMV